MNQELEDEVKAIEWYHTLELAPGIVTPGWQDTRTVADRIPWPASLAGLRCLDVGSFDGFWAFEMEKRGAAEVIAIDVPEPEKWDWPYGSSTEAREVIGRRKGKGTGFDIAARSLGSKVQRVARSVYDVDDSLGGPFDLIYLGSLLVHLRDPIGALERLRAVCAGRLIVVDGIDLFLSSVLPGLPIARLDGRGRPWWWHPSLAGLKRMVEAGGFEVVVDPQRIFIPPGAGQHVPPRRPGLLRTAQGRRLLTVATLGDPHGVVVGLPRP